MANTFNYPHQLTLGKEYTDIGFGPVTIVKIEKKTVTVVTATGHRTKREPYLIKRP